MAKLLFLSSVVVLVAGHTFVQLTDIHLDEHLADHCSNLKGDVSITPFGISSFKCDSAPPLVEAALDFVGNLNPKPDFVLWSGDTVRHNLPNDKNEAIDEIQESIKIVARRLKSLKIPVAPSIGNNDLIKHNTVEQAPCQSVSILADSFKPFLSTSERKVFKRNGGYFTRKVGDGVSLITLNTNYFIESNKAVGGCKDSKSPAAKQLHWLQSELKLIEIDKRKALITGHIPPGKAYKHSCFRAFVNVLHRYKSVISGGIYGHYHNDDFHVLENEAKKIAGVVWQVPSVTASYNPGVRVWKYDPVEGSLLDYDQYFVDLPKSNAKGKVDFALEYSAISAYGLRDMSAKSWNKLLGRITLKPKGTHAVAYHKYKTVSHQAAGALLESKEWRWNIGQSFLGVGEEEDVKDVGDDEDTEIHEEPQRGELFEEEPSEEDWEELANEL